MGAQCKRCFRQLIECQSCKGKGGSKNFLGDWLKCGKCGGTGYICNEHGQYWK